MCADVIQLLLFSLELRTISIVDTKIFVCMFSTAKDKHANYFKILPPTTESISFGPEEEITIRLY